MVRTKMERTERAKQFMPFSPLKGYEEALREKERAIVPRIRRACRSKSAEKVCSGNYATERQ